MNFNAVTDYSVWDFTAVSIELKLILSSKQKSLDFCKVPVSKYPEFSAFPGHNKSTASYGLFPYEKDLKIKLMRPLQQRWKDHTEMDTKDRDIVSPKSPLLV